MSMNNKSMTDIMKDAISNLEKMSTEEFYSSLYGYTPDEYNAYTEEKFLEELNYLRSFFVNGAYCFEPKYNGEPEATVSKLFWKFISNNATSSYEDPNEIFPTYYDELPKYGIRVTTICGQGSISVVEEFDFKNIEYLAKNATRLKREGAIRESQRIQQLLYDKPKYLDEVKFSTTIDGNCIEDTGIILKVYTKKNNIRYLIDSNNHGNVVVFYENEKYPLDTIKVEEYNPYNEEDY